jgi:uncharacterized membrane protein
MMRPSLHILLLVLATACGGNEDYGPDEPPKTEPDPIPNLPTAPELSALNCPKGTSLTYGNFGEAFLLSYCTMCHSSALPQEQRAGATEGVNFDAAGDVALWRASILARVVPGAAAPMPPAANVPATESALLQEWLNCGAPAGGR